MSFAAQSAQSLYAQMLRQRELDRQRKLEQSRYDDQQRMRQQEIAFKESEAADAAKFKAFDRHMGVAKLQQENAALLGKAYEGGYANPAVEEYARASFDAGNVAARTLAAKRAQEKAELEQKLLGNELDFRKSALSALGGIETSGNAELSGYARDTYVPALLNTSAPRPNPTEPLSRHFNASEIARRSGNDPVMKLRQELQGQQTYKDMQVTSSAFNKIASASDNGAGNTSLIYSFVKMLDASSAVREGELQLLSVSGGYPGLVKSWLMKVKGDGTLDDGIVRQIKAEAKRIYDAELSRYGNWTGNYKEEARLLGIDPNRVVFDDFRTHDPALSAGQPPPPSGAPRPPVFTRSQTDQRLDKYSNQTK